MMKKALVAGATGYLGSYLVKELKKQGYWVRALARNSNKLEDIREYIDEVLLSLKYAIKKSCHEITIQSEGPVKMHSFPGSFAQVITNLLMNAIMHAYDAGEPGHIVMDFKKVLLFISPPLLNSRIIVNRAVILV